MFKNKNTTPIVSVIIPVYNTELFLRECLDSIINQTLKEIEIICINDGSTDNSIAILEEYKSRDDRIIVLTQENKGAGAARNAGLNIAHGEYLAVLDSDDLYNIAMLEKMYKYAYKVQADIILCLSEAFDNSSMNAWNISCSAIEMQKSVFSYKDTLSANQNFDFFFGWAWDKLFRRSFIDQHQLRFQEISHSNDGYFVIIAMYAAKRISILREPLVKHRVNREGSIEASHDKNPLCFHEMHKAIKDSLENLGIFSEIKERYTIWVLRHSLWVLNAIGSSKSFVTIYSAMQNDIFPKTKLLTYRSSFFDEKIFYDEMKKIAKQSALEYLFDQRKAIKKEHDFLQTYCNELKRELNFLKNDHARLHQMVCSLQEDRRVLLDSLSFRLGRVLTWFPRKVRDIFIRY